MRSIGPFCIRVCTPSIPFLIPSRDPTNATHHLPWIVLHRVPHVSRTLPSLPQQAPWPGDMEPTSRHPRKKMSSVSIRPRTPFDASRRSTNPSHFRNHIPMPDFGLLGEAAKLVGSAAIGWSGRIEVRYWDAASALRASAWGIRAASSRSRAGSYAAPDLAARYRVATAAGGWYVPSWAVPMYPDQLDDAGAFADRSSRSNFHVRSGRLLVP
jgi:hypothetical protein